MGTTELRQKVLLASQKASGKGEIGFDKALIMKLFLRTLERGIINHARDQTPSQKSSITHEKLILAVTKASALQIETSSFQSRNKKEVKVFEVRSASCSGFLSEESTITKFVSTVDKFTAKVSPLQSQLNNPKESNQAVTDCNNFVSESSRFKKCNQCKNI